MSWCESLNFYIVLRNVPHVLHGFIQKLDTHYRLILFFSGMRVYGINFVPFVLEASKYSLNKIPCHGCFWPVVPAERRLTKKAIPDT